MTDRVVVSENDEAIQGTGDDTGTGSLTSVRVTTEGRNEGLWSLAASADIVLEDSQLP